MTASQTAEKLSFREFSLICHYLDLRKAVGAAGTELLLKHGNGSETQKVLPLIRPVRFEVLSVERKLTQVVTVCRDEDGGVHTLGWAGKVLEMKR